MVGDDCMGTSLQRVRAQFSNFLLMKLSQEFKLHEISILHELQMAMYIRIAWRQSHTVGRAGSRTRTEYADVTLTRPKVKVKVTGLLNFRKLHFSTLISSAILACSSKLMA